MSLWDFLAGCSHQNTSRVFTLRQKKPWGQGLKRTYVVCLSCGHEFNYDWQRMRYETEAETKRRERTAEAV